MERIMYPDRFESRLARVRHRFAITLESKIEDAVISANIMSRGNDSLIKHLSDSYRNLHGICGIGPTVGFSATGEAARTAEGTLMQAYREGRRLTETETLNLKKALERLRVAAASELRLMYQRGG
jgi:curved DNA-binding protein CbpA